MLGAFREPDTAQRVLALSLTVLAVVLSARLQSLAITLRAREETSRWASNLRDLANLAAAVALLGAFEVAGLPTWGAIVASGTVIVLLECARQLQQAAHRRPRALWLGLVLSLPVAVWPAQATAALNVLAVTLFGG